MAKFWAQDGKIVTASGKFQLCDDCPCGAEPCDKCDSGTTPLTGLLEFFDVAEDLPNCDCDASFNNQTFLLTQGTELSGCLWDLDIDLCNHFDRLAVELVLNPTDSSEAELTARVVRLGTAYIIFLIHIPLSGGSGGTFDCSVQRDLSLDYESSNSSNARCDWSASSATWTPQ